MSGLQKKKGRSNECFPPPLSPTHTHLPQSRPLYLGLALWPGALPDAWADGASPCPPPPGASPAAVNASASLVSTAVFAPYALRVDAIAALHVPPGVLTALLTAAAAAGRPGVVTGALFRGAGVRSPPRVFASADLEATTATGIVATLVADIVLTNGALSRIDWADVGCVGCGGRGGGACVQAKGQASCAAPLDACITASATNTNASSIVDASDGGATACGTTLYAGFTGADRARAPLVSGAQLRSLRRGSAAALADAVRVRVKAILAGAASGALVEGPVDGGGGAA